MMREKLLFNGFMEDMWTDFQVWRMVVVFVLLFFYVSVHK